MDNTYYAQYCKLERKQSSVEQFTIWTLIKENSEYASMIFGTIFFDMYACLDSKEINDSSTKGLEPFFHNPNDLARYVYLILVPLATALLSTYIYHKLRNNKLNENNSSLTEEERAQFQQDTFSFFCSRLGRSYLFNLSILAAQTIITVIGMVGKTALVASPHLLATVAAVSFLTGVINGLFEIGVYLFKCHQEKKSPEIMQLEKIFIKTMVSVGLCMAGFFAPNFGSSLIITSVIRTTLSTSFEYISQPFLDNTANKIDRFVIKPVAKRVLVVIRSVKKSWQFGKNAKKNNKNGQRNVLQGAASSPALLIKPRDQKSNSENELQDQLTELDHIIARANIDASDLEKLINRERHKAIRNERKFVSKQSETPPKEITRAQTKEPLRDVSNTYTHPNHLSEAGFFQKAYSQSAPAETGLAAKAGYKPPHPQNHL